MTVCAHCRAPFKPRRSHQVYCSRHCRWGAGNDKKPRLGKWVWGKRRTAPEPYQPS